MERDGELQGTLVREKINGPQINYIHERSLEMRDRRFSNDSQSNGISTLITARHIK